MMTWSRGRAIDAANRVREEGPLRPFVEQLYAMDPPLLRVALRPNVEHNHVLRELLVIVTARSANVPRVHPQDRITVDVLGYTDDDISHATARFGFQEDPDIPGALRLAGANGVECDTTSKARPTSCRGPRSGSPTPPEWIARRLFVAIWRNSPQPRRVPPPA